MRLVAIRMDHMIVLAMSAGRVMDFHAQVSEISKSIFSLFIFQSIHL